MSPPANAMGGETRPLAARINPMKNIFLDTYPVLPRFLSMSKQKSLCPICASYGPGRLRTLGPDRQSLHSCAGDENPAEFKGQALRLGARCICDQKLALDAQSIDLDNHETVIEPQVLADGPTRDEPDSQSRFHGG